LQLGARELGVGEIAVDEIGVGKIMPRQQGAPPAGLAGDEALMQFQRALELGRAQPFPAIRIVVGERLHGIRR
jgi:hypothetical protein